MQQGVLALRGERGNQYEVHLINLKDYSFHKYRNVDDSSFGGGPGMVMRADILKNALENAVIKPGGYTDIKNELHIVYTSPRGKRWDKCIGQRLCAQDFFIDKKKDLLFICGRYEGIDERFVELYINEELCIGDFQVLTGGELAVMIMLDSALRFVPRTLGTVIVLIVSLSKIVSWIIHIILSLKSLKVRQFLKFQ